MTSSYHYILEAREFYINHEDNGNMTMNFGEGDTEHGYSCFGFCLVFNENGSFIGHGAFE